MESSTFYLFAADLLLWLHTLFVSFVVLGLAFIVLGKLRSWSWVLNPWFRIMHLGAIAVVVIQSWCGAICPLTTWEMTLRSRSGDITYEGSFIAHWLSTLLYHHAPLWVFAVSYTLFGTAVIACWFWVKPNPFRH